MTRSPAISVIVCTFNRSSLVTAAIRSVWAQTNTDYELIVVDDGSTDNTAEVIKSLQDERPFRYIYQKNGGLPVAHNTGLDHAQGRFVAFLDDDDLLFPYALEDAASALERHPEHGISYSDVSVFNHDGTPAGLRANFPLPSGDIYQELVAGRVLCLNGAFLARASCFADIRYDPLMRPGEDVDIAWRLAERVTFVALQRPMLKYFRAPPGRVTLSRGKYSLESIQRRYDKLFQSERFHRTDRAFHREIMAKYELQRGRCLAREQKYRPAIAHYMRSILSEPGRGVTYLDALRALAGWLKLRRG